MKKVLSILLSACLLIGCSNNSASPNQGTQNTSSNLVTTIKVGVVGENNEQWEPVIQKLKSENINLELVKFSDYSLPNQALVDKEIDLNAFQHYAFLEDKIKTMEYKIIPLGETIIAPLGVYSNKLKSIDQLPQDGSIAIPNDATNGGRALKLLESAGIIKVKPEVGFNPTLSDIIENTKNIKFYEVEAAQTFRLMSDVDIAIINGGHAKDNSLNPSKDAIYLEKVIEGVDNPFINIIVARTEDKDNENYKKVVNAYRSEEVAKVIDTVYNGIYKKTW